MSSLPNPYTAASEVLWEDFPRKQFSEECFRALNLIDRNREYLESLSQANGEEERAAQALSDIAVASGRLERILTDMMALIRCIQGNEPPIWELVDLCALLRGLCAGQEQIRRAIGVTLTLECDADGCCVYGDRGFLEQICLHLLSNALRACREGGHVWVVLEPGRSQDDCSVLRVLDDGCGLPDEERDNLRENRTHFLGGTQSGLLLCREYCRLLGWELELNARPEGGTEAVVKMLPGKHPLGSTILRSENTWDKLQQEYRLQRLVARELNCIPGLETVDFER